MSLPAYPSYVDSGLGWLGKVPSHWQTIRLNRELSLITEKAAEASNPIALENLESGGTARLIESDTTFKGVGTSFKEGDILFGKLRPYLAKGYLAREPGEAVGDFHVLRSRGALDPEFALRQILSSGFIEAINATTHGAKMPRVGWDALGAMVLVAPPQEEQRLISRFLARETVRVDRLVAKQERLIELLQEKRQALITRAVTKGLDPTVPMKDSGVEWLGEVPAHWATLPLRRVIENIEQGWSPQCHGDPPESGEWGIVKSGCVNNQRFDPAQSKALPESLTPRPDLEIKEGDVLMSRASGSPRLVGSVARAGNFQQRLMLSDKIFRLRLRTLMDSDYFILAMGSNAVRTQIELAISGADGLANNLPQSSMLEIQMAIPPIAEQVEVVRQVNNKVVAIDAVIRATEASISTSKEHRSALISAAVTGKIDVREAA